MTTPVSLTDHLRLALEHLAGGRVEEAQKAVSSPEFKAAFQAIKDVPTKTNVGKLLHSFEHAFNPALAASIAPIAADALREFDAHIDKPHYAPLKAVYALDGGVKRLDAARMAQAKAFTAAEAAHYAKRGPVGYAVDLIKRRWNADGAVLHAAEEAHVHGPDCGHAHHHAPVAEVTPNPNALEEFGEIKLLRTGAQKLAVAGGAAVGLGLVVHGAKNVVSAATHHDVSDIEVPELGHEPSSGGALNWTQLAVGIGEAAVGAALAYRLLTGRAVLRAPVEGKAESLLKGCSHHGHTSHI